jgi:hypothetical protein
VLGLLALLSAAPSQAATVTYTLDQSNVLPDGVPYVGVIIQDDVLGGDQAIKFTVGTVIGAFTPGSNFGIQRFGFNVGADDIHLSSAQFVLPDAWRVDVRAPSQISTFGRFEVFTSGLGNSRENPLIFWITGVNGDTPSDYVALSTTRSGQETEFFAAHVAGFVYSQNGIVASSAFFGGSEPGLPPQGIVGGVVPLPPAVWLLGAGFLGYLGLGRLGSSASERSESGA